jgi:hypothetical protein
MTPKLGVFVSSVQKELEDERLIVQDLVNTDARIDRQSTDGGLESTDVESADILPTVRGNLPTSGRRASLPDRRGFKDGLSMFSQWDKIMTTPEVKTRKKLIEVALPLEAINKASVQGEGPR